MNKKLIIAQLILNAVLLTFLIIVGFLFITKKIIIAPKPVPIAKQFTIQTVKPNKTFLLPIAKGKQAVLSLTITSVQKTDRITAGKNE